LRNSRLLRGRSRPRVYLSHLPGLMEGVRASRRFWLCGPAPGILDHRLLECGLMKKAENEKITVYQKPTCSKCRSTLKILRESNAEFESVNYYETPLACGELKGLIRKLGLAPRDIIRKDEQVYRDLGLARAEVSDDDLVDLMVKHPDLIQRPIVVKGNRAVLGRPPENVLDLIDAVKDSD
jgi:arsenate reductase